MMNCMTKNKSSYKLDSYIIKSYYSFKILEWKRKGTLDNQETTTIKIDRYKIYFV